LAFVGQSEGQLIKVDYTAIHFAFLSRSLLCLELVFNNFWA